MRFRACVVVGDGKGRIGYGIAKGKDVITSIEKSVRQAKRQLITVPIVDGTIPHEVVSKHHAAKVMLKPAPQGTGVIASTSIRAVVELAGVKNIVSKIIGSKNIINNVQATFRALEEMRTSDQRPNTK